MLTVEKQAQTTSLCNQSPLAAMVPLLELLLLTLIFLTCLASSAVPASPSIPESSTGSTLIDHHALMSFRSLVRSDPLALASWGNRSVPMCQWHGVTCGLSGRRRGRVVVLDLTQLNLGGKMSPALGNLTYLRQLLLPSNHFSGTVPSELGYLHDLQTLDLSYNSIGGQVPPSLSNCSHLVNIFLYGNKLQGQIPSEFGSLRNLEQLSLGLNRLTGSIPSNIGGLMNLKFLSVEVNNLTGEIPQEIGNLVNLEMLFLDTNQFSGSIPASLGNLSALILLNIVSANLTGSIPPLQGLSSLKQLTLGQNNLEGAIPPWLGNLSSLTYLDLGRNRLVGQIPESLGNLGLLTFLDLDNNKLEGELHPSMFNLSFLEVLNTQSNFLTGSFPPDMGNKLPKLQNIYLGFNRFDGIIPPSLCNNSMLQIIEISNNFFSGTIPPCLGVLQKNLTMVSFSSNHLKATDEADWVFLSSLTNCSNLWSLDIGHNNLQGVLPNSIGNRSMHLKNFVMESNNITGIIPEGIGNLVNLELFDMDNNLLQGTIPLSLGKVKNLTGLYLSNNNLSGSIPSALGNLTKLAILALQGNAFGGIIPSSINNCPLQLLDLSYNSLTGPIPKEIFLISTLSDSMHISHNLLTGSLPSEVGNLKNLAALDLSGNRISGEIPTSTGDCQSLEYLNISGNILQGAIPPSLGKLKGLTVLDLSHNNLSGGIPEFLGSLRGLSSLNLSFNKFEGPVPEDGVFLNATAISITRNDDLCGGIPQLKLQPCFNHTTKKPSHKLVIIISVCSAVLFITLVFALSTFYHRSMKMKANMQISLINEQHPRVSYVELVNATNGFASENLIGAGSFGSVYKGTLRSNDRQVVIAVKVLNLTRRGASRSFVAECETLRCVRHRNLVKILTVCSSIDFQGRDFKALIYEFLPNGNLDKWLHQHLLEDGEHKALDLHVRLQIAIDVACSLEYLHKHKPSPIIHCDLKPSNVLLDSDMVAHVGDFGLARFLHQDLEISSGWASMRGTIGYAAPEYGLGNEVSIQGDVYSYGILLLEMFTGKRPTDTEFGEAFGLCKYVQMALPNRAANVIDPNLLPVTEDGEGSFSNSSSTRDMRIACIASILHVGISCSEETPTDRVQIGDALRELLEIRDKFHYRVSIEGAPSSH